MKFLVLGDIFPTAINELKKKLPNIIKKNKIDFVIANGENAARDANGITKKAAIELFNSGIDVLTSGNHIWDKKEIMEYIKFEKRLLRPANMHKDLPGQGINIFKKNGFKICVINLMTNKKILDDAWSEHHKTIVKEGYMLPISLSASPPIKDMAP